MSYQRKVTTTQMKMSYHSSVTHQVNIRVKQKEGDSETQHSGAHARLMH